MSVAPSRRIDWSAWQPKREDTLLFVVDDHRILLIEKKRGLGGGNINGPGGRIESGETPEAGAVREFREELVASPSGTRKCGELWFHVLDGPAILIHIFRADRCVGEPIETDEAVPMWVDRDAIPYERMWEDDRLWIPHMLAEQPFTARTVFDGDRLLEWELDVHDDDYAWNASG